MRVSTNQINMRAVNSMLDQQGKLSDIQNRLASGKRILSPADDPIASGQSLSINQSISVAEQYQSNSDIAKSRLSLEESTMQSASLILNRVRELAIQGNNATSSDADRKLIALEMKERLDELLSVSNTRDSNGEYIYAGFQGATQPFIKDGSGGFTYLGDEGQRLLQIGTARTVALGDSGKDVFLEIRNGNGIFSVTDNPANTGTGVIDNGSLANGVSWNPDTYTITFTSATAFEVRDSGNNLVLSSTYTDNALISFNGVNTSIKGAPSTGDVFTVSPSMNQGMLTTVQNIITAFEFSTSGVSGTAPLNNSASQFLTDIDQALDNVHNIRASIGARLNTVEAQKDQNETRIINAKQDLSELVDLDYVKAISDLNLQRIGLESAQKTYIQIQGLSLFNYL